jgi:adenylate cyclase
MAKLILISSEERQEFELVVFNSIGRHPDNTIQILDRILSKEHAQIHKTPEGRFLLRDLGSLNGTYIRGERVHERILADGDEIALGSTRLLYVESQAEEQALQRVTIAPGMTESHIRQRIAAATSRDFVPERDLADERQLRRDYEKLRIGYELGRAVGTELDLDKLLPKILDKAFELVNADRGVILLMDGRGELVPRYVKQKDGRQENIVLSRAVMAEVVTHKSAVLSSDATMDSRFSGAHSIIMQGIRSTMTVPLLMGDEMLGIMHLDSQIATNAFAEKDLQILTGIAAQAAVAIQNARLAKKIEQEAQTRAQISRLVPPNIVEQVVAGELVIERGGKLQEVTMLYSDIRGFTAMSERTPPEQIVRMLNEYFEVMVDILFKHEGTLDKFVGDEIIGLFGAPIAKEDAAMKAVACALDMQQALSEFNRVRANEGSEPIHVGIGINTGMVVTGAIGSSKSLQYTAIGDAMNTASRLCGAAKANQIIVSEWTLAKVSGRINAVPLEPVEVKNKRDKLKVFNVVGLL